MLVVNSKPFVVKDWVTSKPMFNFMSGLLRCLVLLDRRGLFAVGLEKQTLFGHAEVGRHVGDRATVQLARVTVGRQPCGSSCAGCSITTAAKSCIR